MIWIMGGIHMTFILFVYDMNYGGYTHDFYTVCV